ncbi:MAG TPA: hypothetical protein VFE60_02495 [Roseiarcus sp.]|jgi:hypothetical protein|nr:hypothetical protein [Roseiarcus sp.]
MNETSKNQTEKPTRAANVALYEGARQALSATVKVDEVQDLLDRSAALVEYARRAAVTYSGIKEPGAIGAI